MFVSKRRINILEDRVDQLQEANDRMVELIFQQNGNMKKLAEAHSSLVETVTAMAKYIGIDV